MTDLVQLERAAGAAYQAAQASLRDILAEETRLRSALADLDAKRSDTHALAPEEMRAPRAVGADILWQAWVQRTRQELNMRLARTLVSKSDKLAALRLAFGRVDAVKTLIDQEKSARRKAAQDREFEEGQSLALLRSATSAGARSR